MFLSLLHTQQFHFGVGVQRNVQPHFTEVQTSAFPTLITHRWRGRQDGSFAESFGKKMQHNSLDIQEAAPALRV